ncbi:ABC transporter permease [Nocardiopsis trehalosi]|uniref:ABC transporter permease n=1 Tax=Nocardiopsis trehalosi TaxID=109329 RepID=UPI000AE85A0F|nr:ABC transporter permease [Nocardiopsis trehalosi]
MTPTPAAATPRAEAAPPPVRYPPRTTAERVARAAADTAVVTGRNLVRMRRAPADSVIALVVPVMMVLLFGYVFGGVMAVPGGGDVREFLLPGIAVMTMMNGVATTATGTALDADRAVMGRFRSLPMAPSALLAGRAAADTVRAVGEVAVLGACGLLVGWTWHRGPGDALLAVGLLLLFRFALIWLGILLGLVVPSPDAAGVVVWPLVFPLSVLSTTYVPPALMPGPLGVVASWNPVSSVVEALRTLFGNPTVPADSWIAENAVAMAVAWPLLLIALCAPLAVRRFRRTAR